MALKGAPHKSAEVSLILSLCEIKSDFNLFQAFFTLLS